MRQRANPNPNRNPNATPPFCLFTDNTHLTFDRVGFFVGGPVLAAVLAVAANYGSKQENEAGEAMRGISANAIEAFNFLTNINSKYDVTGESSSRGIGCELGSMRELREEKRQEAERKGCALRVRWQVEFLWPPVRCVRPTCL